MAHNISIISSSIRSGIQTISWINTRLTDYISYPKINACLDDHCFCDWRLTWTRLLNSQWKCRILFRPVVNQPEVQLLPRLQIYAKKIIALDTLQKKASCCKIPLHKPRVLSSILYCWPGASMRAPILIQYMAFLTKERWKVFLTTAEQYIMTPSLEDFCISIWKPKVQISFLTNSYHGLDRSSLLEILRTRISVDEENGSMHQLRIVFRP